MDYNKNFNKRISLKDKQFPDAYQKNLTNLVFEYVITFGLEECSKILLKQKLINNIYELQDYIIKNQQQLALNFNNE